MITLRCTTQGGTQKFDLDVNEKAIPLNYQFWSIDKPFSLISPYSFNFNLPFSKTNDAFFSFYFDANTSDGTFSSAIKTEVELYVDSVLVMSGVLQLHACGEKAGGYTVSILEQISKLFDVIKGMTFPQLFTDGVGNVDTDLDHSLTWANVTNSWVTTNDITSGLVGNGTIVYPLSDWGQGLSQNNQNAGTGAGFRFNFFTAGGQLQSGGMDDDNLNVQNFKPAIRVKYLLDYIAQKAGYTIQSDFLLTPDFLDVYMFLATETKRSIGRALYGCQAGLQTNYNLQIGQASLWEPLSFHDEASPNYDPDGLVVSGQLVAPFDGVFTVQYQLLVETLSGPVGTGFSVSGRVVIAGESTVPDQSQICAYQTETTVNFTWVLELTAGQSVAFLVNTTNTDSLLTIRKNIGTAYTYLRLDELTSINQFVDVSENFGDVTVDKFLKGIAERFNLIIYSTPKSPTVLQIEDWNTWLSNVTETRDWTDVVDQDSININPTTKFQKQKYLFADAQGKSFVNRWWAENFGWVKGQYEYLNTNDFVSGESKTQPLFEPLRNRQIYPTIQNTGTSVIPNVLVPCFWDWHDGSDGSIYLKEFRPAKPVLAYYNGLQPIGNGGEFQFGGTQYTTYPYFSEFNEVPVSTTTKSLAWGYDWPDNYTAPFIGGDGGGATTRYAFTEYWSRMFNELFGSESRIMTCSIELDYTDLYNLDFKDNIYLDGCFWRLMKIDNYALGTTGKAEATLFKVVSAVTGRVNLSCSSLPISFNVDGTVNFVDSSGNPTAATEDCCTLHGYIYSETKRACFYKPSAGGGGTSGGGGGNGGGGVGNDGANPNRNVDNEMPTAYTDFSRSKVNAFSQRDTIGNDISTNLFAQTTGLGGVNAVQNNGIGEFTIPQDSVIYVRLQAVITEVGGVSGTVGNTSTQNIQATVANTSSSPTSQSIARQVGVTTTIAENKDSGTVATISIRENQASDGALATFTVYCTGSAGVNLQWFIDAQLTTLQLSNAEGQLRPIVYNLDPNIVMQANLSGQDFMYFNLEIV